jgi:hypothetical protein
VAFFILQSDRAEVFKNSVTEQFLGRPDQNPSSVRRATLHVPCCTKPAYLSLRHLVFKLAGSKRCAKLAPTVAAMAGQSQGTATARAAKLVVTPFDMAKAVALGWCQSWTSRLRRLATLRLRMLIPVAGTAVLQKRIDAGPPQKLKHMRNTVPVAWAAEYLTMTATADPFASAYPKKPGNPKKLGQGFQSTCPSTA